MVPKTEKLYTPSEAARILGISISTLRRWEREGKIRTVRTAGGHRRIPESEIRRILGQRKPTATRCVIYARVSSQKQAENGDLDRQVAALRKYAEQRAWIIVDVLTDIGSELREGRRGLKKLFDYVTSGKVDVVLITHRDRLTRFGFGYLKYFFRYFDVEIVEAFKEEKSPLEELVEDFVSIVVSFAGRIYGMRSHRAKKFVEDIKNRLRSDLGVEV